MCNKVYITSWSSRQCRKRVLHPAANVQERKKNVRSDIRVMKGERSHLNHTYLRWPPRSHKSIHQLKRVVIENHCLRLINVLPTSIVTTIMIITIVPKITEHYKVSSWSLSVKDASMNLSLSTGKQHSRSHAVSNKLCQQKAFAASHERFGNPLTQVYFLFKEVVVLLLQCGYRYSCHEQQIDEREAKLHRSLCFRMWNIKTHGPTLFIMCRPTKRSLSVRSQPHYCAQERLWSYLS